MTNASPPFLDPEVVARITNLEFRARQIVDGLIAGRHRSRYLGYSVEFAQHREYVAGDDLRHLDWKVWARNDRLYIKQFEEETSLRATLLVDASESMIYGQGEQNKFAYACQKAAALAYLLLQQSDSVGLALFDEQLRAEVPHRSPRTHLHTLLQAMQTSTPTRKTDIDRLFAQVVGRMDRRGLIVVFSDLFADRERVKRALRSLKQGRHDVIVFHIMHDDEVDFLFQGMTRFEGIETVDHLTCDPRSLREDYLQSLQRYLSDVRQTCSQAGIDYRFVRTSEAIDAVLASLIHERSRV